MKNTISVSLVLLTIIFFGFTKTNTSNNEPIIGDIRYSILAPDQFRNLPGGQNWLPLDGGEYAQQKNIDLKSTSLARKFGISSLPDARGMFIRGMNLGRKDEYKDLDSLRIVGSIQPNQANNIDQVAFDWGATTTSPKTVSEDGSWSGRIDTGKNAKDSNKDGIKLKKKGVETRPNNISFYLYIKVN